ncbi:MAG: hypothetical protein CMN97_11835 [Synechococcus sp. NAT40]|nr:hypothetical protein [Synechococcus sp. NAT40]
MSQVNEVCGDQGDGLRGGRADLLDSLRTTTMIKRPVTTQLHSIHADVDQELSIDTLSACSGGDKLTPWGFFTQFAVAVYKGAKEIEETQRTGKLPERFHTPVSDIFGGDGVWMPPGGDTSDNPGVFH